MTIIDRARNNRAIAIAAIKARKTTKPHSAPAPATGNVIHPLRFSPALSTSAAPAVPLRLAA